MKPIAVALLASFAYVGLAHGEDSKFEFTLSGELVGKLEPDTRVLIWSPVAETKPNWARFAVKELPVSLPYKQLAARHMWIASFISPAQRQTVFSIGLAPELFEQPRRIELKLDRPTPRIRPSFVGKLQFEYYSAITQQLWYWDLPSWDKKNKRIVPAEPPLMRIVRISDGKTVQESAMKKGCMGSKWWAAIAPSLDLGDKTELRFTVRYDSGGLWEPIESKLSFRYRRTDENESEEVEVHHGQSKP
jgi:hypothetical protein